ncbi:signal transduction histidine kinase [Actinopolyspora biskrensis]|uniref:histidine kinase n=1 Tax=Actinopolyspora biskrensis TaxID=1470178 RepID=A0A852YW93_9ACTN|nr:sensor histidine kinase [Actinopolyspora biskrensis]NYH77829.1 signal transduction histidine kinase [Actinopolyspora biskrensis]
MNSSLRSGPALVIRSAGMAGLTALAVAGAVTVVRQRNRITELTKQLGEHEAELEHLRTKRLPALAESMNGGTHTQVPGPLGGGNEHGAAESVESLVDGIEEVVRLTREHVEQASRRTLTGVLDTVRGLAAEQHMAVSEMQHRHDDANVLADLYTIDHAGSQLSRRLRGFAVLFGAWIGQQRSATPVQEILRGAQSQIRDYQRITVSAHYPEIAGSSVEELGVITRVVEPLVLVIAELLDNAARYSPPYAQVAVGVQPAHNGVAITIDDAGVGMPIEEQRRAERLLSNEHVALDEIGDPPRVGFAVVGLLAARYGLRVSVDAPPSYGGVRAVVFVPNESLTHVEREQQAEEPAAAAGEVRQGTTSSGLPKRSRRDRDTTAKQAPAAVPESSDSATGLAAWQQATEANSTTAAGENEGEDSHA